VVLQPTKKNNMSDNELLEIDSKQAIKEFFLEVKERAKLFPRNSIEHYNPNVAAQILWMLAQGGRISVIAKKCKVSHELVRSLEWRHNDTLESKRKEFSKRYAIAAAEYTDLLFEKAEQLSNDPEQLKMISPDRLALTIGIMTDKAGQLSGMASTIVEHRKGASIDDAAKMIAEAKSRIANKIKEQAIDVEVVE
jgi:hypothetical protein